MRYKVVQIRQIKQWTKSAIVQVMICKARRVALHHPRLAEIQGWSADLISTYLGLEKAISKAQMQHQHNSK